MATRNLIINIEDWVNGKVAGAVVVSQPSQWVPPDEEAGESWDGWPPQPESRFYLHVLLQDEAGSLEDLGAHATHFAEFEDDMPAKLKDKDGKSTHQFWGTKMWKNKAEKDLADSQGEDEQ